METFEVTILGCGSALPTMRHLGTSQIVNIRNKYFMVDCSEGTQLQLRKSKVHLNRINTIFISHLHGDHCFGLPGYISSLGMLGRTAPLHIYGPADIERVFRPQLDYFCNGLEFEVVFHEIDTTKAALIYEDKSLTVETIPLRHRVACCGYLFKEKEGLRHLIPSAVQRYEVPQSQFNNIKNGLDYIQADGTVVPNSELTTPPTPARSYAFCSDTAYTPSIVPLIKDVDLLYHEATYGDDCQDLAKKYFHSTAREAGRIALDAHAGKLVIGHYSQRYTNEQVLLEEARTVFPNTLLAEEGLTIEVGR